MLRHWRAYLVLLCLIPLDTLAQVRTPLVIEAALDRQVIAPLLDAFERIHVDFMHILLSHCISTASEIFQPFTRISF